MRRRLPLLLVIGFLALSACVDDAVPTGTTGDVAADLSPQIQALDATPAANNQVVLKVQATDPSGSPLTFSWTRTGGDLSTSVGPSTIWRAPKDGGNFTVTVTVSNGKGLTRTASQQFKVNGDQVTADGGTQISSGTGADTPQTGTGRFSVPTPVPFATPSLFVVGGNPNAPTPVPPSPSPPFNQPVATPVPGPTPTPPPQQPIATPTPNTATPTPTPTPFSTPRPNAPEPGVPAPAPGTWTQVPPANIPTGSGFLGVSFVDDGSGQYQEGWVCGPNGTVLRTTDGGVTWAFRNTGVPASMRVMDIRFVSPGVGFICGSDGNILRTTDSGANWELVVARNANNNSLPAVTTIAYSQIVPINQQILWVSSTDGRVFRSENGNAAAATGVSFTQIDTKPPGRPNDITTILNAGATFPTTPNSAYFVSDGVFRADNGADPDWSRQLNLGSSSGTGTAVYLASPSEIWVGTDAGYLFHSSTTGASWTNTTSYFNREHNGGDRFLPPKPITAIQFPTENSGWVAMGNLVRDTQDRGASWKETQLPAAVSDMQIERRITATSEVFLGWAVGAGGVILRYVPN